MTENKDNLKYECIGTFEKICKENNLPFSGLCRTYRKNTRLQKTKFKDWYARIIN